MSIQSTAKLLVSKGEVKEKMKQCEDAKETLEKGQKYLIAKSLEIIKLNAEIDALQIVDKGLEKKLEEDLEAIKTHPIVKHAEYVDESMEVLTDTFTAYTQGGIPITIKPMRITLGLLDSKVRGFNVNRDDGFSGYWTQRDPHPHTAGDNGAPCLGEAACTITELITHQDYYAAMLMVLEFFQSINETDAAGKKFVNWMSEEEKDKYGIKKKKQTQEHGDFETPTITFDLTEIIEDEEDDYEDDDEEEDEE